LIPLESKASFSSPLAPGVEPAPQIAPAAQTLTDPITFLIYSPYPRYSGGRENWLYNLSSRLLRRGRSVTVISHASSRRVFYPPVPGLRIERLPSIRYFDHVFLWMNRFLLGLPTAFDLLVFYPSLAAWHLSRTRPKVLVCMNSIPEGLAAAIARRPYTVSVRGDVPKELSRGFKLYEWVLASLERRVLRRAVRVLANGNDTRDRLWQQGIAAEVVPNGVDLARFRSADTTSAIVDQLVAAAAGRPVISVVGTLRPIKGSEQAIFCAAELKKAGASFLMAMVGKGAVSHYHRLAQSRQIDDVVWFSGETKDVPAILKHTDVFLALSGGSGFSMAVLEAMAAGVAVVALDSPVYSQLLTDGVNGLLAPAAELPAACLKLLRDREMRRRLGAEAALAAETFDWELVANRLLTALAL
jgi:glycosyltransferase involved in cell wall biosynthesis